MRVFIDVDASSVDSYLSDQLRKVSNLAPALTSIGDGWKTLINTSFVQQRDPWGNAWLPLRDSTLSLRRRRGNTSSTILRDSGKMQEGVKSSVTVDTLEISITAPAAVHQQGNPLNLFFGILAPIPARSIVPIRSGRIDLPDSWQRDAVDSITRFFLE